MKRLSVSFLALALLAWSASCAFAAPQTLKFGRFGTVTLYRTGPRPDRVVLFVSGDGGWNRGVVDMAKALAADGALVVGTGVLSELALGWCTYGVGDQMSHYNVNASVPKTLIRYLIGWVAKSGHFEHAVARTGQIGGCDEAVVASADDDDVPLSGHAPSTPSRAAMYRPTSALGSSIGAR